MRFICNEETESSILSSSTFYIFIITALSRKSLKKRIVKFSFLVVIFSLLVVTYAYILFLAVNRIQFSQYIFKQFFLSASQSDNVGIKFPTIKLDTNPPEITIVAPQKEVFSKNSILKITAVDKNLNPVITINNKIYQTDNTGFLIYPFEVKEGKNIFVIKAQDIFGNIKVENLELDLKIAEPKRIPILMYHHITSKLVEQNSVAENLFSEQLDWLKENGYNTISFSQLNDYLIYGLALPDNPILLSFDDGYIDNYQNAFKILVNKGMKGSFGIITSLVGTDAHGGRFYMSWDELKEMDINGMELVDHSMSHKYMPKISDSELVQELLESKKIIEEFTNKKVETFIYPTGGYNNHVIDKLKEYGFRSARISGNYKKMSLENIFTLPVIKVVWGTSPTELGKLIKNN